MNPTTTVTTSSLLLLLWLLRWWKWKFRIIVDSKHHHHHHHRGRHKSGYFMIVVFVLRSFRRNDSGCTMCMQTMIHLTTANTFQHHRTSTKVAFQLCIPTTTTTTTITQKYRNHHRSNLPYWYQNHSWFLSKSSVSLSSTSSYTSSSSSSSSSSSNDETAMTTVEPTTPSSNDGVPTVSYDLNKYDYEQYYHCFFDQHVPEGRCVGIQLLPVPNDHIHSLHYHQLSTQSSSSSSSSQLHWLFHYLHPEEIQYGLQLHHMNHRRSFYMGRLAIRHALQQPPPKSFDTRSISSSSVFLSSLPENVTIPPTNTTTSTFYQNKTTATTNSHNFNSNPTASSSSSIRNSILKDMYGRPKLPYGYLGSISHKGLMGVALVQEQPLPPVPSSSSQVVKERPLLLTTPRMGIGVDIEDIRHAHRRRNVARKVLTPHEIQNLGTLSYQYHHDHNHSMISTVPNATLPSTPSSTTTTTTLQYLSVEEEILLRFSCKESVYKAIHPLLNQYVSFQEAEIQPYINGTALVTLHLAPSSSTDLNTIQKHEQQFQTPIIVHWYRYENYIITTASICLQ